MSVAKATPRSATLRRVEGEIAMLLRRVKRVMAERARLVDPDMQPITFFLLNHIAHQHGPVRAADLVGTFGMDKGGVSRQVQGLVDGGFVERQPDPDDRRAQLLVVTEAARERLDQVASDRSARFDRRLKEWSTADLEQFAQLLERYNAALDPEGD